jgi:ferric-dicitrate binding protein FerR (iron transport regulator)
MPPTNPRGDTFPDEVTLALLYAGGRLSPEDAEAFERRLGEDQQARDALCRAMELVQSLAGRPLRPRPDYRERVRQRLRPPPAEDCSFDSAVFQ